MSLTAGSTLLNTGLAGAIATEYKKVHGHKLLRGMAPTIDAEARALAWYINAFGTGGLPDPTTTQGDLLVRGAVELIRLPAGPEASVLTIVGGMPTWNTSGAAHDPVTLDASATAGGLSLIDQELFFQAANTSQAGYLTASDWNLFYDGIVTNGDSHDHIGGDGAPITEGALSLSDVTTADVSITAHGLAPKAPNDPTQFLSGDGTWRTVSTSVSYRPFAYFVG